MLAEELTQETLNKLHRDGKQSYPFIMRKKTKEQEIIRFRERQFKDIIHWNSNKPSLMGFNGFYGWLWHFCRSKRAYGGEWYHSFALQPMRDMSKMIPQFSYNYGYMEFDNVDDHTLVLIKHSSKRKDYRDEKQWKDIIDFIRDHNTRQIIYRIFFCTYNDKPVKIRDKEWKFIEDAGCTYIKDMSTHIWINDKYRKEESPHWELKGKLFEIKY